MTQTLGPYEANKIYQGDNVTLMKDLPDNCISLTITSPPYDLVDENMVTHCSDKDSRIRDYGQGYDWDFVSVADQLYRVTSDKGGTLVWIVNDQVIDGSETGSSFRQALHFMSLGFKLHDTMIYEKINPFGSNTPTRYKQAFEFMFVFVKGKISNNLNLMKWKTKTSGRINYGTIRKNRKNDNNKLTRKHDFGKPVHDEKIAHNVWGYFIGMSHVTKDKIAYDHPAIFPEDMAYDHIVSWSQEGDLVFDPFLGSGTTAKMAKKAKRKYLGFEVNPDYIAIAQQRLGAVDVSLF